MTDEERRELAELFREDDRLRAENADYLARRKAERLARENAEAEPSPPVEKSGNDRDQENAMAAAPLGEPQGFDELQKDALAAVYNELRSELMQEIEHLERRLLDTVVRLIRPGEVAELQVRALADRIAIAETRIERQLSAKILELSASQNAENDVIPNWRQNN